MDNVVIFMRGVPGSGKSTTAENIRSVFSAAGVPTAVVSADNFWISEDGEYKYDHSRIQEAHDDCESNMVEAFKFGAKIVIVDNCHYKKEHMVPYREVAQHFGAQILELKIGETVFKPLEEYEYRGTHDAPVGSILKMMREYER